MNQSWKSVHAQVAEESGNEKIDDVKEDTDLIYSVGKVEDTCSHGWGK